MAWKSLCARYLPRQDRCKFALVPPAATFQMHAERTGVGLSLSIYTPAQIGSPMRARQIGCAEIDTCVGEPAFARGLSAHPIRPQNRASLLGFRHDDVISIPEHACRVGVSTFFEGIRRRRCRVVRNSR